jgi:predicted 3-demethylubiquinone-9 3-methyltransferase (glyoxalase superfamily)
MYERLPMQKITPFLWYNDQAEKAARFYVSVFKDASIIEVRRGGDDNDGPATSVTFALDGREYIAFNGGPHFTFTPAMSLFVHCETQAEIDYFWDAFCNAGGTPSRCGWLTDKYGLSWQIVPNILAALLGDSDADRSDRAMQAMLTMSKLDIAKLQAAAAG